MSSDKQSVIAMLSKIQGMLQCMACMEGAAITRAMTAELECDTEQLSIYIGELIAEDVKGHEDKERVFDGIIR